MSDVKDAQDPCEADTLIPHDETETEKLLRAAYVEQGKVVGMLEQTVRDQGFRILMLEREVKVLHNLFRQAVVQVSKKGSGGGGEYPPT